MLLVGKQYFENFKIKCEIISKDIHLRPSETYISVARLIFIFLHTEGSKMLFNSFLPAAAIKNLNIILNCLVAKPFLFMFRKIPEVDIVLRHSK